jgi:hypothetical protein
MLGNFSDTFVTQGSINIGRYSDSYTYSMSVFESQNKLVLYKRSRQYVTAYKSVQHSGNYMYTQTHIK